MSSWLPKSLGGQSKEEKQADEAKAWRESYLGTGDEHFTHSREAAEDNGHFKLTEVRKRPTQADRGGSRLVRLPKGHYEEAPMIAKGLKSCDLSHKSKDHFQKQAIDIQCEVFADNASIVSPLIQAWLSDESTQQLYDAEMVWIEAKHDAHDSMFITTTFNLEKGEKEKKIEFLKEVSEGAELEVVGWAQGFRFATEKGGDYNCDFWASKVDSKGFTGHADCSENAERLCVTWIVTKKGKKNAASGSFSTGDTEGREENAPEASGKVEFEKGVFDSAPTVVAALSQFDMAGGRDFKLGAEVTEVTKDGFSWKISTLGDTSKDVLRSAEAAWVALGSV